MGSWHETGERARDRVDPTPEALAAIERHDWEALKPLLHPYLRWMTRDGETVRGRSKVMARLVDHPPSSPPWSCELRDGQIYRWTEGPS